MKRVCLALLVVIAVTFPLAAQDPTSFEEGFVPYQTYRASDFDSVNMLTGNVVITIPIISYPQRGTLPDLSQSFVVNAPDWEYVCVDDGMGGQVCNWQVPSADYAYPYSVSRFGNFVRDNFLAGTLSPLPYPESGAVFFAYDATGALHVGTFFVANSNRLGTDDASGITGAYVPNSPFDMWYPIDRNGIQFRWAHYDSNRNVLSYPRTIDPSGNTITELAGGGWTDSIGRTIPSLAAIPRGTPGCTTKYFPGPPSNDPVHVTVCYSAFNINMMLGGVNYNTGTFVAVSSITLPNGTSWSFTYDGYGDVTSVTTPTGGKVTYTWGHFGGGSSGCSSGTIECKPYVTQRTVNPAPSDPSQAKTWNYTYNFIYPYGPSTDTDPDGNYTVHTFTQLDSYDSASSARETDTKHYDASSHLLKEVMTQYSWAGVDPAAWSLFDISQPYDVVTRRVTTKLYSNGTLVDVKEVCTIYDNNADTGCSATSGPDTYISANLNIGGGFPVGPNFPGVNGNLMYRYEYDYGTSAPGGLLRKTVTQYQWQSDTNYLYAGLLSAPSSVVTYDGSNNIVAQTTYTYDESGRSPSSCQSSPCADLTTVSRWLSTSPSNPVVTHTSYTSYGMSSATVDGNANQTNFTYDSTNAYLSQVQYPTTNGVSHSENYSYDSNTGLLLSHTDQNSQTTTYIYDSMRRLTGVSYPGGGSESYSYNDSAPNPSFTLTKAISSGSNFVQTGIVDGLGRKKQTQLTSDPDGTDIVDYTYDDLGRLHTVSNPHRSGGSPTDGMTTYDYDPLNRVTSVVEQDGSIVSTSYIGNCTTVTDEAGKQRKSCVDGAGRMTGVWEDPGGVNYETDYQYDALDNLVRVDQKGGDGNPANWRTRTFSYDSLSRLLSAYNPESGTTSYTYDANGNVIKKTDARAITTCFGNWTGTSCNGSTGYDALNRVLQKSYSDGTTPTMTFQYDLSSISGVTMQNPIGRLVVDGRADGEASTIISYDPMGRVNAQWDCTPVNCGSGSYPTTAHYNLAGDLDWLIYPSGRKVTYQYNGAMRPTQVRFDSFNGTAVGYNYLSGANYSPAGTATTVTLGSGVTETSGHNSRLQPSSQQIALGSLNWVSRTYGYGPSGQNNGNVMSITDNLQPNRTQNFSYDNFNRISQAYTSATSGSGCFGEDYNIDPWANLSGISGISGYGSCVQDNLSLQVGPSNKFTTSGFSYDAAGNLLSDGYRSYGYDAESRLSAYNGSGRTYSYDAEGRRVEKQVGSDTTEYIYFNGLVIAERKANGDWTDYIWSGNRRLAMVDGLTDISISNGSFESGLSDWGIWGSAQVINNASNAHSGSNYLQLSCDPGHAAGAGNQMIAVQPGEQLTFGGWANLQSGGGGALGWWLAVYDSNFNAISYVRAGSNAATSEWTYQGATYTVPSGAAYVRLYSQIYLPSVTTVIQVDDGFLSAGTFYYHADHLGSARLMTDSGGSAVWSATYAPYGMELDQQITVNHYKFTGKERDSESDLDYFGARYMSSQYGRFMTPDPQTAGASEDDPQSWNGYAYARNNPLLYTDPDGLMYYVCIQDTDLSGSTTQKCTWYDNNDDFYKAVRGSPGASASGGNIYVNGQIVGSYEYFGPGGDGTMGTTDDPFLFPAMFGVVESGARSLLNLAGSFLGDIGGSSAASLARGGIGPVLKGAQGVERAIAEVEAEGGTVLGREITIDTAVARARADFVYRSADGELVVGEAKNGPRAALTANQRAAYQSLKSSGGRFVGGNAAAAGLPSTVGPTTVRVFAYH